MDNYNLDYAENEVKLLASIINLKNRNQGDYKLYHSNHNKGGTTAIGRCNKFKKDLNAYISDDALDLISIYLECFNDKEWNSFKWIRWIADGNKTTTAKLNESPLFESFCYGNAEGYKYIEEEVKDGIAQQDIIHHAEDYIDKIMLKFQKTSDTLIWRSIFHLSSSIYYNRISYKLGKIEGAARKALMIYEKENPQELNFNCDTETNNPHFQIIDRYDSDLIYLNFSKYLGVSKEVFDYWFVTGKIRTGKLKKMQWNFCIKRNGEKVPNKAQLRAFLKEICGVDFEPSYINLAFVSNLEIDSHHRRGKIDNKLLVLLRQSEKS
jgi:hypothetical protein